MPTEKMPLTDALVYDLKELRKSHLIDGKPLTAQELSFMIGKKNRAWLSQIETQRLSFIKKSDVDSIFRVLIGEDFHKSEEYITFMKRFANGIPANDHISWRDHELFSAIDPDIYATIDFEEQTTSALKKFNEVFNQQIKDADSNEKRFFLLRSLKTLNQNMVRMPDLTMALNTTPLSVVSNNAAQERVVSKAIMDMLDTCFAYWIKNRATYNVWDSPWIVDQLCTALSKTEQALAILKEMFFADTEIEELRNRFNSLIQEISSIRPAALIPCTGISPINDDIVLDEVRISQYIIATKNLKNELTELYNKLKSEKESIIDQQRQEHEDPEYQAHRFDGLELE